MLAEPIDSRGLAQTLRYGPSTGQVGDVTFADETVSLAGVGLRPWSVSHVEAVRAPSGDVAVRWVRRTRFAGDAWTPDTVPLNEERETYVVRVLGPDGFAARTATVTAPAWTYPAAAQTADFGAPQPAYTFSIAQASALFGPGQSATRTVTL